MRRLVLCLVVVWLGACTASIRKADKDMFDAKGMSGPQVELDEQEVSGYIDQLDHYQQINDPKSEVLYDEAIVWLTKQGSYIEPYLIERIASTDNWAVKFGALNVLDSVGTKRSIESFIACLLDNNPEVSLKALYNLRAFSGRRFIPKNGKSEHGMPPVPPRDVNNFEPGADLQIWQTWTREYGAILHRTWEAWWNTNKERLLVQ